MNESRLSALLLFATLTLVVVAVAVPQRRGSAQVPDASPTVLEALAAPATSTSISFGVSIDLPASTTTSTLPRVDTTTTTIPTTTTSPGDAPATTTGQPAATTTTAPPSTTTTVAPGSFNSSYESQFASSINGLRSSNGLSSLSRNGSLDSEARSWAKQMAESGGLGHSNLGRLLPPWSAVAENVGYGASVSSIFDNLVASSGHYANIVGNYTHMGIGVWVDASGLVWTTHLFAK